MREQEQQRLHPSDLDTKPNFVPIKMTPRQQSDWERGILHKEYGLAQNSPWEQFREPVAHPTTSGWSGIRGLI